LSALLKGSGIKCYAWAVLDRHFHLLLRTGGVKVPRREKAYVKGDDAFLEMEVSLRVNAVSKSVARGKKLAKKHAGRLAFGKGNDPPPYRL
jgi:hypothetical protein